ncbi:acyl-CoA thioesterase II [soil metagenome]
MEPVLDVRETLKLEAIGPDLFRGTSMQSLGKRIYGGQVVAQSLLAAFGTIEDDRLCDSLHCYFLRAGDPRIPIDFDVVRLTEGRSFAVRSIMAKQGDRVILSMMASFHVAESGFEHQSVMPQGVPGPEGFEHISVVEARLATHTGRAAASWLPAIDMRVVDPPREDLLRPGGPARKRGWFRVAGELGDDPRWHQVALAYASDRTVLTASLIPHGTRWSTPGMTSASLDHAVWFHRPTDITGWHLYDIDSPSAAGALGYCRGAIYAENGRLVASTAQQGLIRPPADRL